MSRGSGARWPFGRLIAAAVVVVACGFFVQRLEAGDSVWAAFMKSAAAGVATMVVLGGLQRFWRGDKLKDMNVSPTGAGGAFEDDVIEADEASLQAINDLNARVDEQMSTVNQRLYDLELAVFKPPDSQSDQQE